MVKLQKGQRNANAPSSALGIMRFMDADPAIVKLSPYFVIVLTGVLIVVLIVARNFIA